MRKREILPPVSAATLLLFAALFGCGQPKEPESGHPAAEMTTAETKDGAERAAAASPLAGTNWRLVEIQSMDDSVGTVRPDDPSLYTMRLGRDGAVSMHLDCNRATGTWSAEPGEDGASGSFQFSPLAATQAVCPPSSLDERITAEAEYVRSYLLRDGRLHLSLMADGGIVVWEPDEGRFQTEADAEIEKAILNASPSYTREVVDIEGETGRGRYVYSRFDLNGDGTDEVFVYLLGPYFCGSGGCNLQVFTPAGTGYSLIHEFPITREPVIVSSEKTLGWNDIIRKESGGGAQASYVRHVFDGKGYVERERLTADEAPEGTRVVSGGITFEEGIPLPPHSSEK